MSQILILILCGIVAWAVCLWLLTRARLNIYWDKAWRGHHLTPTIISTLFWTWKVAPYPILFYLFVLAMSAQISSIFRFHPFFVFLAYCGLVALADTLIARFRTKRERLLAGRTEKPYPRAGTPQSSRQTMVFLLSIYTMTLFGLGLVILIVYFIWRASQGKSGKLTLGKGTFEFDELCPILYEIRRMAVPMGKAPKKLFVRGRPKKGGLLRVPLIAPTDGNRGSVTNPLIPVENLIYLNPQALTAGLAVRWAREVKPDSAATTLGRFTGPVCGFAVFVLTILYAMIAGPIVFKVMSGNIFYALTFLFLGGIASIYAVFRMFGMMRTRTESLQGGLKIWHCAEPYDRRTVKEFINYLGEYHSFFQAIADPDVVVHQFRVDRAVRKFLRQNHVDQEMVLNSLREHLLANPVWPTRAEQEALGKDAASNPDTTATPTQQQELNVTL